ncbi:MAG: glycosyltransferase [Bacteroidales bacterium]|nr:glycosyltransferase [Bacteroidales bacterium]
MNENPLVSIIIPAFNAEKFIEETILSVILQSYKHWELWVINDGSTDETYKVASKFLSQNVHVINQQNKGVSHARNTGMNYANGQFILFLDADDVLTQNFIEFRLYALLNNPYAAFACGEVWHFKNNTINVEEIKQGVYNQIIEKILLYDSHVDTVPSNYLFRKEFLVKHNVKFDERLSSTADRMFLLDIAKFAEGVYVKDAPLLYRVHENSMSQIFNVKLVNDNELFFKIVIQKNIAPQNIKMQVEVIHAYILAASFLKIRHIKFFKWLFWGASHCPLKFFKYLLCKKF